VKKIKPIRGEDIVSVRRQLVGGQLYIKVYRFSDRSLHIAVKRFFGAPYKEGITNYWAIKSEDISHPVRHHDSLVDVGVLGKSSPERFLVRYTGQAFAYLKKLVDEQNQIEFNRIFAQ
jgi:hypothetical protein